MRRKYALTSDFVYSTMPPFRVSLQSVAGPRRGHDKVVLATSSEETRRQLVKDWWSTQEDSETPIVIATRRSDTGDFNDKVARP
jgi:hypothetical protein